MRIQRFSKTLQNPKIQIKLIFTQFCKGWQFAASLESHDSDIRKNKKGKLTRWIKLV